MKIKDGYFEKGRWIYGLPPSLIGKKIIRVEPCKCKGSYGMGYLDYSYCLYGKYFEQPNEWVI
jgi:hypothetical protein